MIDYINNLSFEFDKNRHILQFNRTSLRIDWFKRNFENTLNVALIRNPRDQFESYIASKMPIFLIMNLIIISRKETISSFKSLVKEIDIPLFYDDNIYKEIQFYKSIVKKISLENHYKIFFTIWLESFIHAKKYADVIVNTNLLNQDENYKKNIEIK